MKLTVLNIFWCTKQTEKETKTATKKETETKKKGKK